MYLIIKLNKKDVKGSVIDDEVSKCRCIDCVLPVMLVDFVGRKVKCVGCLDDDASGLLLDS